MSAVSSALALLDDALDHSVDGMIPRAVVAAAYAQLQEIDVLTDDHKPGIVWLHDRGVVSVKRVDDNLYVRLLSGLVVALPAPKED